MPYVRPSQNNEPEVAVRPDCRPGLVLAALLLLAGMVVPAHAGEPVRASCPAPGVAPRSRSSPTRLPRPTMGDTFDITSDKAIWGLDGRGTLSGNVVIHEGGRQISSKDAEFDQNTGVITALGAVHYSDPLMVVSGSSGHYSPTGGASFHDAQFEFLQREARGTATDMELTPAGLVLLSDVTFTTCPTGEEFWHIHANSLTLDGDQHTGTARGASLRLDDVPVMYLPWLSFPLDNVRKTGFLFPSLGSNSRSGAEITAPWYWDIAPNYDLTLEPSIYSRRGLDAAGDARYMTDDQSGELIWHYLPHDSEAAAEGINHADRSYVHLVQTAELPDNVRVHIDAANVGDSQYFQDFGEGPAGTSVVYLDREAEVSYRNLNWQLLAQVQQYQELDGISQALVSDYRPYARRPRLVADGDFTTGPGDILHYGVDTEIVDFDRAFGVTGWRMDTRPHAMLDFEGPGWFVRPGVAYEFTQYMLQNTAFGQDANPTRALPTASFDTGLTFERPVGTDGGRTLTLEPRMLYVYTPYRNQDQLPIFDTALPDLNIVELFNTNRFVGYDRVSDANQVTTAITTRLLDTASGQQFLSATLGQTYYFTQPQVLAPENPQTGSRSDLVAEVSLAAYEHWNVNAGLQWDPQMSRSDRTVIELQYKPASDAVINVAYRFQRDTLLEQQLAAAEGNPTSSSLDQMELSTAWPVADHWNLYGRVVYALDEHQTLERFAGFEYHSCCWAVRLLGRRALSDSTGRQDTGIFLQLELNGLASVGSTAGTFLGNSIQGYSPTSPTP